MEIRFHDPSERPRPPSETRVQDLIIEPWEDGRRVDVEVRITPFQQPPNLYISVYDKGGQEVAAVGAMQIRSEYTGFTLHLRQPDTRGQYTVSARLAYPDAEMRLNVVHQVEAVFNIP